MKIGYSHSCGKAYCRSCRETFSYCYNGINPFSKDTTCPKCGILSLDDTEHMDLHIMFLRGLVHSKQVGDVERRELRKELNELIRIRRVLSESDSM